MKQTRKTATLRYTIWIYFMLFISIIVILLWLFQVVFLQGYYQVMKTEDIQNVASTILNNTDEPNYLHLLTKTAYDNNMCIEITDKYGFSIYSVDMMAGTCEIHGKKNQFVEYQNNILNSADGIYYAKISNDRFKTQTLLFGMMIGTKEDPTGYILLNTSLDPLTSTIVILQKQMLSITISLMILSSVLSFYIAKRIARPIVNITKSAKKLGEGNYNIRFDGEGLDETELLADTLNFASKEISTVDSLRKDLIANISHDLRTPLTMVKAYAEMVRDLSGDNPVKRAEHIGVIIDESDRLAALVNDILDLSKIESSNNTNLNLSNFDICEKLTEIIARYQVLSEQQGYIFNLELDQPITINADVLKIEQVLYNLINNAINYTGSNKTVTVRQINKEQCVRIEIIDSGNGISEELLPLIFDRYYRAEKTKREVVGTGLGLSIVKSILKQHNYPFGVQSTVGEGSTFWVEMRRGAPTGKSTTLVSDS